MVISKEAGGLSFNLFVLSVRLYNNLLIYLRYKLQVFIIVLHFLLLLLFCKALFLLMFLSHDIFGECGSSSKTRRPCTYNLFSS